MENAFVLVIGNALALGKCQFVVDNQILGTKKIKDRRTLTHLGNSY